MLEAIVSAMTCKIFVSNTCQTPLVGKVVSYVSNYILHGDICSW